MIPILAMSLTSTIHHAATPPAPRIEGCLTKHEMREAVEQRRAIQPLLALRAAGSGEKIRAELCRTETGLVYLITALGRDGHVARVIIDALSGQRLGSR